MNIQAEKLKIIEWITKVQDVSIIEKIISIKKNLSKEYDWWDNISEAERLSIEQGEKNISEGKVHNQSEAKKIYGKYL